MSLCQGLGQTAPLVDSGRVRRKNVKLSLCEPAPRLVVRGRNRGQQREPADKRCAERAHKTSPSDFELAEFAEQDEVAALSDIAFHCRGGRNRANSIKMASRHAGAQIVEDRKPRSRR